MDDKGAGDPLSGTVIGGREGDTDRWPRVTVYDEGIYEACERGGERDERRSADIKSGGCSERGSACKRWLPASGSTRLSPVRFGVPRGVPNWYTTSAEWYKLKAPRMIVHSGGVSL